MTTLRSAQLSPAMALVPSALTANPVQPADSRPAAEFISAAARLPRLILSQAGKP